MQWRWPWRATRQRISRNIGSAIILAILLATLTLVGSAAADEVTGTRPLRHLQPSALATILPNDTHLLFEQSVIERFLEQLDGQPPDWGGVYGGGHHDPGHDDRLFQLNRDRDAGRVGRAPLTWRISFAWDGALTGFDPKTGGFSVGIGPRFVRTAWGLVRFKAEDLPGNLTAIPDPQLRKRLRRSVEQGERIPILVLMTGRLIPDESLVYDFSHDEEGLGLIMPVVRIERLEFVLTD